MNIQFNDLTLLYSFDMLKRDNLVWSRKHGLGKVVRLYGKDSGWEARGHGREASSTRFNKGTFNKGTFLFYSGIF